MTSKKNNEPLFSKVNLSDYSTFKVGGPCKSFIECHSPFDLINVIIFLNAQKRKFALIGAGSNLLISDKGVDCTLISYSSDKSHISQDKNKITVSACTPLDALVVYTVNHSLKGMNFLSGIPGSVGGAIIGNAGAFGQEISTPLISVDVITTKGMIKQIPKKDLRFCYRDSSFKTSNHIILSATFKMRSGAKATLNKERKEILALRRKKHPDLVNVPCVGSIFKNVDVNANRRVAAGLYLDQAGVKQLRVGGASIFSKHANIIVNKNKASAEDIYSLIQLMAKAVKTKHNISLKREIRMLGDFKHRPKSIKKLIW